MYCCLGWCANICHLVVVMQTTSNYCEKTKNLPLPGRIPEAANETQYHCTMAFTRHTVSPSMLSCDTIIIAGKYPSFKADRTLLVISKHDCIIDLHVMLIAMFLVSATKYEKDISMVLKFLFVRASACCL